MKDVLDVSGVELARRIRQRELSPVELVQAHIDRIERVNPWINAVVVERYEEALTEARAAEERVTAAARAGEVDSLPPLLGVPCTVKEFLEMKGLPNTAGVVAHRARRGTRDATVVRRVREAGAIVLGLTNAAEGGLWMETHSPIYGRTLNPYNRRRTAGGSSGGEGAIIGAGGSPFGLGADIGGSIRIPAAFCGIVGHKPTGRMVPSTGHFPQPEEALQPALCLGPMARRAADLMPLLRILAGPDGECGVTRAMPLGEPNDVRIEELTVYRIDAGGRPRFRAPMIDAMDRAARALEDRGARVEVLREDAMRHGVEIWGACLQGSESPYSKVLSPDREFSLARELVRLVLRRSRHTSPALMMVLGEYLTRAAPRRTARMARLGAELKARFHERLGDKGVLLYPPYTRAAPRHRMAMVTALDGACTCIFNVLELPLTVMPVGFDPDGLPVSVQIGARCGNDHLTIAVAQALEEDLGGWHRATPRRG